MKQTSLPEVIYLYVDNLTTENNNAALVASMQKSSLPETRLEKRWNAKV